MEYPKPVMKMGELVKMGFPRSFLDEAYRERGQDFAQKGPKSNSPILDGNEKKHPDMAGLKCLTKNA